jgi:hypothetical protein
MDRIAKIDRERAIDRRGRLFKGSYIEHRQRGHRRWLRRKADR